MRKINEAIKEANEEFNKWIASGMPGQVKCHKCGQFLGRKEHDCPNDNTLSIEEAYFDDGTPPENAITCPKCGGYGLVPAYSFTQECYEADDCPVCGGEGWIVEDESEVTPA